MRLCNNLENVTVGDKMSQTRCFLITTDLLLNLYSDSHWRTSWYICWPQSHTFTNTCTQNQDGSGSSFVSILIKLSLNNVKFLPCVLVYQALRLLLSPLYDPNSGQEDNLHTYMYIHTYKLIWIITAYIYTFTFVL